MEAPGGKGGLTVARGKSSFVLYHDIRGPLEMLSDEERGKLFSAILNYSEYGEIPQFSGALQMAFAFIRTALDRDADKWEDKRQKRVESGRLGGIRSGEARREANEANASNSKQTKQNEANEAVPVPAPVPVPVPVPAPVPVPDNIENGGKPPRAARFTPPSFEEVQRYCAERRNGVDPQRFVDYYTSNGWKVGRNQMKDWKAAVRTWEGGNKGGRDNAHGSQDQEIPGVTRL